MEDTELLFPWMVMAGVVLAAQHGAHISIAWFVEKLPEGARRPVAILNCVILVIAYGILVHATVQLLVVADERSHVLCWVCRPRSPIRACSSVSPA